jgi:E3 ubiquitin-protein ligase RNF38/44
MVPENLEYLRQFLISIHGEEVNVDMMSYEELMQLEEQIGRVNRGLPEERLRELPEEDARTELLSKSCSICLEDFARGEKYIRLRCQHVFHAECIVAWLKTEKHCVLCKKEVVD